MKNRLFIFTLLALLLAACNMTLAADVTPPPNYVPPTPMPTLGALHPAQPMDIENGAKIYAEKCAACHGKTGLGDGAQSQDLPVKVAPIGLADVARKAQPSAWYKIVTQGNIEKFMPPFASLNDQERWDVVGYALALHTTEEQLAQGKSLLEANCSDCEKYFTDLETMSKLSEDGLKFMVQGGMGEIPAFGKNLSDEELTAVAVYLRSLTFAARNSAPQATPEPQVTASPESSAAPQGDSTPEPIVEEASPTAEVQTGFGNVRGSVDNQSGAAIPAEAKVILHVYDHGSDMSAGPQEVDTLEGALAADGTFIFENVEIPARRIFVAEALVNGASYQSGFELVEAGMTEVVFDPIVLFASTDDLSALNVSALQLFFDFSGSDAQMVAVYSIVNDSGKTVTVDMGAEQKDIPFIAPLLNAQPLGFEATQDSAPFVGTETGFAMPPSQAPYGLIAFYALTPEKEMKISQPVKLAVDEVMVFLPEGMKLSGGTFTDDGVQSNQGMTLHMYSMGAVQKDSNIEFTLTGKPESSAAAEDSSNPLQNKTLLFGVGAFGVVLILAGGWLFWRDRNRAEDDFEDEEDEEDEESDSEDVLDAILALDDLYRAGKISDEAYRNRRSELKTKLKQ